MAVGMQPTTVLLNTGPFLPPPSIPFLPTAMCQVSRTTTMSKWPTSFWPLSMTFLTWSTLVRSAAMAWMLPLKLAPSCLTLSRLACVRAVITTFAPWRAYSKAIDRPLKNEASKRAREGRRGEGEARGREGVKRLLGCLVGLVGWSVGWLAGSLVVTDRCRRSLHK